MVGTNTGEKIPQVRSMDLIFTSVLKVSFLFYNICFDFLLLLILIKLQPETSGRKKKSHFQAGLFLVSFFT